MAAWDPTAAAREALAGWDPTAALREALAGWDVTAAVREVLAGAEPARVLEALTEAGDPGAAAGTWSAAVVEEVLEQAGRGSPVLADARVRYTIQVVVFVLVFGWLVGATWGTPENTVTQVLAVLEAFGFEHGEGALALAASFGSGKAMNWLAGRA